MPAKPSIPITPVTSGFWSALEHGRLQLSTCRSCGHTFHYPRDRCPRCWAADIGSTVASGRGTVLSHTVIHRPGHPAWEAEAPYLVVLVRLAEGPVLLSSIVDSELDEVRVGTQVRATVRDLGSGPLVVFTAS